MNIPPTSNPLTAAWQLARRLRSCPPDAVLHDNPTVELLAHLKICPDCRADRATPLPGIRIDIPDTGRDGHPGPVAGELWTLRNDLGGWGPKDRYYNPPVVLVTTVHKGGFAHVIQTYGDRTLAGPGDIILGRELDGFAEPWNRYTLKATDLGTRLAKISDQTLEQVKKALEHDPSGPSPEPGSLLWFFRQLEIETGYYFANRSVTRIMEENTTACRKVFPLSYRDSEELLTDLARFPLRLPREAGASILQALATVLPADDLLPKAAARQTPEEIQPLLFTVEQGRIVKVEAVSAIITARESRDNVLSVTGTCELWAKEDCTWIFRLQTENSMIEPLPGRHGASEGVFWAAFPSPESQKEPEGTLLVRILRNQ
ncbi:hypothetical protein [Desulfolithobacter sp.]